MQNSLKRNVLACMTAGTTAGKKPAPKSLWESLVERARKSRRFLSRRYETRGGSGNIPRVSGSDDRMLKFFILFENFSSRTRFGSSFPLRALNVCILQLGFCMAQRAFFCTMKKGYARKVCCYKHDTFTCLTSVLTFSLLLLVSRIS